MKRLYFMLLLICVCICATAEPMAPKASLSGHVTDASDKSPLVGVTIYIPELSLGTTTDENGNYVIADLPLKTITLQISYLGHQTIIKKITLQKNMTADFVMKESNAMINEVVVTGLAGNSLMKDSPTPVSVLTAADIKSVSSTNIIDAIAHQPGISQITTGSGISKPVIRGLGYNRIVTVNDGVRQEGQQWGDEHGIEIDPQTVNNIEILKGPASLMYGSDAMAGVVIFHDTPTLAKNTVAGDVSSEYQTNNGLFDYSLHMAGNNNGYVWGVRYSDKMAHAYKNKYDGYVDNSQFRERAMSGLFGVNKSWGYSHLKLSYYHLTPSMIEDPGAVGNKDYSHGLPYQQIHHYKAVLDNSFYVGDGNIKAIFAYQQNRRQEFEDAENPNKPGLDFMLHTINYDVHYAIQPAEGLSFASGVNGMYQRSINKGDEFLIPAYALFDFGAFATSSYKTGNLNISGGLRYDTRHVRSFALEDRFGSISRTFNGVTGSIGATYAINDKMNVRLNAARGFRVPNLSELASNGEHEGTFRYEVGNVGLKPEYSWQLDAGWDYTSPYVSAQLSLFANYIDNYIFAHKLSGNFIDNVPVYQFVQGNARLLGGEASLDIHPVERLHFQNAFSYVDAEQLNQPADAKYLPMTPAPRWTSELKYDIVRDGETLNNAYVKIGLECDLRQNHFYGLDNTETATPSYTLLNASMGTDVKCKGKKIFSIYLTGDNLTNRAYQNHLSRLKYAGLNPVTGREGVYNMGRNFGIKVVAPINL